LIWVPSVARALLGIDPCADHLLGHRLKVDHIQPQSSRGIQGKASPAWGWKPSGRPCMLISTAGGGR
jgi:hypothetical protein